MRSGLHPVVALERGGGILLEMLREAGFIVRFVFRALATVLTPSIYLVATREVTARQIYFTAWRPLPWFALLSGAFGLLVIQVVVGFARAQGLAPLALEMILRVLPMELVPFLTALYVALRSGAAINTEVALMHIRGDFERLEAAGGDAMRDEFIPRIVACGFSVIALTVVAGSITLCVAYLSLYGWTDNGLAAFTITVGHVYSVPVVLGLALKCALFGIAVAMIPIASGLSVPRDMRFAAVAVLRGMVRLFIVLALIQAAALAARYV